MYVNVFNVNNMLANHVFETLRVNLTLFLSCQFLLSNVYLINSFLRFSFCFNLEICIYSACFSSCVDFMFFGEGEALLSTIHLYMHTWIHTGQHIRYCALFVQPGQG